MFLSLTAAHPPLWPLLISDPCVSAFFECFLSLTAAHPPLLIPHSMEESVLVLLAVPYYMHRLLGAHA
jgi:hypothetical protein